MEHCYKWMDNNNCRGTRHPQRTVSMNQRLWMGHLTESSVINWTYLPSEPYNVVVVVVVAAVPVTLRRKARAIQKALSSGHPFELPRRAHAQAGAILDDFGGEVLVQGLLQVGEASHHLSEQSPSSLSEVPPSPRLRSRSLFVRRGARVKQGPVCKQLSEKSPSIAEAAHSTSRRLKRGFLSTLRSAASKVNMSWMHCQSVRFSAGTSTPAARCPFVAGTAPAWASPKQQQKGKRGVALAHLSPCLAALALAALAALASAAGSLAFRFGCGLHGRLLGLPRFFFFFLGGGLCFPKIIARFFFLTFFCGGKRRSVARP